MSKLEILENKIKDYEKSTRLNKEIVKHLEDGIFKLTSESNTWEVDLELAEAKEKKFNCERIIASNEEFVRRLREDLKAQKEASKNEVEDMNENYSDLIKEARKLIKKDIGQQEKQWIVTGKPLSEPLSLLLVSLQIPH